MDGAMHKTVLIILAAVVALIVIVVLTGMRYLRADDEDDFDDEIAAERGQSRGRSEHPGRSRHHGDDRHSAGAGQRARSGAGQGRATSRDRADRERPDRAFLAGAGAARRGSGGDGSSASNSGRSGMGRVGMGRDGSSRDGADRARPGRDGASRDRVSREAGVRSGDRRGASRDSAERAGSVRDSAVRDIPGRDVAPRRGWDEAGRDDRRNSGPQRRVTGSRDYDRESADDLISASATSGRGSNGRGNMRPEDFDDRTARLSARDSSRDYPRGQDGGRPAASRDALSRDSAGAGRDDRARDDRERRGNSGQNARPDSRRTTASQSRKDDSLPDVKPRAGKTAQTKSSKRDDDGDWPSTEWDELSDVDYWAELAADKPFTSATASTTAPGRSDRDRADARSDSDSGPVRAADRRDSPDRRESREGLERRERDTTERRDTADRRDAERRDTTDRRDHLLPAARATRPTVDAAFAPPASNGTDAYGSTELRRAIASGRASTSGPHRIPQPADDDPLTSPSFPRISADDSRSYRRSSGRGPGDTQSQTRPHPTYPPAPLHPPVGPLDSQPGRTGASGGYSQPAANGVDYAGPLADPYRQPGPATVENRPALP